MSAQAESAFVRTYVNTIGSQPVTYADDFQQAPEATLKKVPLLPIELPPVPKRVEAGSADPTPGSLNVTFKSTKPPMTYALTIAPSDTIAHIKSLLHTTHASAPPADVQRLLLRGKAMVDTKLVKEYGVKPGDTLMMMLRPGFAWDPSAPPPSPPVTAVLSPPSPTLLPTTGASGGKKHGRTPSIVLSPSPSMENLHEAPKDITLSLEGTENHIAVDSSTPYRETLAKPEFWERMLAFLRSQFDTELDVSLAFEDFLRSAKGSLTANQIAKIRDVCGVVGMAGT